MSYIYGFYHTRLQQSGVAQKKVVLSYLVNCLQSDAQCWLLWQQMFTKHLNSSVALLEQVHEHWPAVVKTVNKTALKQTLGKRSNIVLFLLPFFENSLSLICYHCKYQAEKKTTILLLK